MKVFAVLFALSYLVTAEAVAQPKKKKNDLSCTYNACVNGQTKACSKVNPQGRGLCCHKTCAK